MLTGVLQARQAPRFDHRLLTMSASAKMSVSKWHKQSWCALAAFWLHTDEATHCCWALVSASFSLLATT